MSTDTESVVRRLLDEAWNGGDLDRIEQLVDSDYRSHIDETRPVRTSHHVGPMVVREEIVAYRSAMPNLVFETGAVTSAGDVVMARWTLSGDNTADASVDDGAETIPASGLAVTASGFGRFTVSGGKITEAEIGWELLGPLAQLRLFAAGTLQLQVSGQQVTLSR